MVMIFFATKIVSGEPGPAAVATLAFCAWELRTTLHSSRNRYRIKLSDIGEQSHSITEQRRLTA